MTWVHWFTVTNTSPVSGLNDLLGDLVPPWDPPWFTQLIVSLGGAIGLRLMEGEFLHLVVLTVLTICTLFLLPSIFLPDLVHQPPDLDIRLDLPTFHPVTLFRGLTPSYRSRRVRSTFLHKQYRIRLRIRSRIPVRKKPKPSPVTSRSATSEAQRAKQEQRVQAAGERLATRYWSGYFDHVTSDYKLGFQSTQDRLEEEARRQGVTLRAVRDLLAKHDPVKEFKAEAHLSHVMTPKHEQTKLAQAHIAAADLLKEDPSRRPPTSPRAGGFLADNSTRSDIPIIFDSGCSFSLTPVLEDFIGPLEKTGVGDMTGLKDSVKVYGVGWAEWAVRDVFGRVYVIRTRCYYVPEADIRLFSPQCYFQENEGGSSTIFHDKMGFHTADGITLWFPYHPKSNLPVMYVNYCVPRADFSARDRVNLATAGVAERTLNLLHENNYNLSRAEKELLLWHSRLGHAGFGWIQDLMRPRKNNVGVNPDPPHIVTKENATRSCACPTCTACQLSKQH